MSDELNVHGWKVCPFCDTKSAPESHYKSCYLMRRDSGGRRQWEERVKAWNHRPIEDELRTELDTWKGKEAAASMNVTILRSEVEKMRADNERYEERLNTQRGVIGLHIENERSLSAELAALREKFDKTCEQCSYNGMQKKEVSDE